MLASDSSDDGVTTSLLGKRASSQPAAMRSSKSVISQVRDTLYSFIKRSKLDAKADFTNNDKVEEQQVDDAVSSESEKQRTQEAFTARIKSFTIQNWMGKPLCLSPPLLAQYGWQCIGADTIKCCSCSAVLGMRLPWPGEENYRRQCYKYRHNVLTAHMKICSWPSYPCPDSFVSPFLHGVQGVPEVIIQFIERRTHLTHLGNKLPKIDPNALIELSLERKHLQSLADLNGSTLEPLPLADKVENLVDDLSEIDTASVLAMCGWDAEHSFSSRSPSLFCKLSGRNIGLHNFYALDETAESDKKDTQASDDEPTSKLISDGNGDSTELPTGLKSKAGTAGNYRNSVSPIKLKKQCFHPLQQHSPWSHWIATLKPITKDEFGEDIDSDLRQSLSENEDVFKYVLNPMIADAKPGWFMVMNVLLGRRGSGETSSNVPNFSEAQYCKKADSHGNIDNIITAEGLKTPSKGAVAHVRKLLKEWSSPK